MNRVQSITGSITSNNLIKVSSFYSILKGNSAALVIAPVPTSWFSQWQQGRVLHRGDDYVDLKMKLGRQMWEQTLGLFPHLSGKVRSFNVKLLVPLECTHFDLMCKLNL